MKTPGDDFKEQREHEKQLIKEAFKDGLKEWLDEKFAAFGWWSLKGIAAISFFVVIYFWLSLHGWKAPAIGP